MERLAVLVVSAYQVSGNVKCPCVYNALLFFLVNSTGTRQPYLDKYPVSKNWERGLYEYGSQD